MSVTRLVAGLITLLSAIALTGCGGPVTASATQGARLAHKGTYTVGVRTISLGRGTARPLTVTIWYPAVGEPYAGPVRVGASATACATVSTATPAVPRRPRPSAPVAAGRFPLVLFSHGILSAPELHAPLTTRWAAAGFVVAAPKYPHTSRGAKKFSRADVRNQPGDAQRVIRQVLRLDTVAGDPFAGHLDSGRIAAAGHSAGGYTTSGLFTAGHLPQLRAGIVIGGAGMAGSTFGGPPATLLFVHGGADPTVSRSRAVTAYEQVRWPKAFLTLRGQGHSEYLTPGRVGFDQTARTTTDFLRWTLYDDAAAHLRIPADARCPGGTDFLDQLDAR